MSDSQPILDQSRQHHRVKQRILYELGRRWKAGDRLPPVRELAKELGVGQNNTFRAVAELVEEGVLVSRPRYGTFVSDRVDRRALGRAKRARVLAGKRVALLLHWNDPDSFLRAAMQTMTAALDEAGARIEPRVLKVRQMSELAGDCDGAAAINPNGPIRFLPDQVRPLVVVATSIDTLVNHPGGYDVVGFDSDHAGFLVGSKLRELGCRQICFVGCGEGRAYDRTSSARLASLSGALDKPIQRRHQLMCRYYMSMDGAKVVTEYLKLSPRPDGICAASDELAVGFIHGAAAHGLEPARDYQIIGFDGQDLGQRAHGGPLTTIRAPMADMGRRGAELLIERMVNPSLPVRREMMAGELFEGVTTRAG